MLIVWSLQLIKLFVVYIKWTEPKVTPKRNCNLPHTLPKLYQVILLMFKVTKIHQPTKKSKANLWSAFSWVQNDDPKKGQLFKYMAKLLSGNRLWLCSLQKTRADKKYVTYFKSADLKFTLTEILTYSIRYLQGSNFTRCY